MQENNCIGVHAVLQYLADTGLNVKDSYSLDNFWQFRVTNDWFNAQKEELLGREVLVFLTINNNNDLQIDWAHYDTPSYEDDEYYFVCKLNRNNLYEELKQYVLKVQETNRYPALYGFMKEKDMLVSNMNTIKTKQDKLNSILEDKRIQQHPIYYEEFEGNFLRKFQKVS
jgi:hypothetical protein